MWTKTDTAQNVSHTNWNKSLERKVNVCSFISYSSCIRWQLKTVRSSHWLRMKCILCVNDYMIKWTTNLNYFRWYSCLCVHQKMKQKYSIHTHARTLNILWCVVLSCVLCHCDYFPSCSTKVHCTMVSTIRIDSVSVKAFFFAFIKIKSIWTEKNPIFCVCV